jgi:uncharacterized protein YcbK (DUF882 family)
MRTILQERSETAWSRRRFIGALAAAATGSILAPRSVLATQEAPRELSLFHTHTREELSIVYFADGTYLSDALKRLNHFLADFRTGDVKELDPKLFDILHGIQRLTGSKGTYEIIAAYRSPKTNEMLRQHSSGVAKGSLHLQGRAIDVRLSDLDTAKLRDVAQSLRRGGVGYYAKSDFVHVDTGRVRYW